MGAPLHGRDADSPPYEGRVVLLAFDDWIVAGAMGRV